MRQWHRLSIMVASLAALSACELIIDPDAVAPPSTGMQDAGAQEPDAGCVAKSCSSRCGTIADGCGGTIVCGRCPSGMGCRNNTCVSNCVSPTDPELCLGAGATCGTLSVTDRCGAQRSPVCGAGCPSGQVCGGSGHLNVCWCDDTTCFGTTRCDVSLGTCVPGCSTADQCSEGASCENHQCRCEPDFHVCEGACVPNDVAACGATCERCPADPFGQTTCDGTSCGVRCPAQHRLCLAGCTSCPAHGADFSCQGIQCVATACSPGYSLCDGRCCSWHLETITLSQTAGQPAIALDGNGVTHVAFYASSGEVRWAKRSPAGWLVETVKSIPQTSAERILDLAVGSNGEPVVVFVDGLDLRVAERHKAGTSGWTKTLVEGGSPMAPALVMDLFGNLHVAFGHDGYHCEVRYAYRTAAGQGWAGTTLDSLECLRLSTAIALDGLGKPAVAAMEVGATDDFWDVLKQFRLRSGGWTAEQVEVGDLGDSLELDFDSAGTPYLAYFGDADLSARLASRPGGSWNIAHIEPGSVADQVGMSLDAWDVPHLGFLADNGGLRHGWLETGLWESEQVATDAETVVLAIDAPGRPRMVFREAGTGALRYAWYGD
ncbi:MAG: hypothetical protein HY901_29835 [Deltaproteobacteria bacterium]|nr:hypothetical protein [Deltaproteobacteria bacterium]